MRPLDLVASMVLENGARWGECATPDQWEDMTALLTPGGARRAAPPPGRSIERTSSPARSSIGISRTPSATVQSMVVEGNPTQNGTPLSCAPSALR